MKTKTIIVSACSAITLLYGCTDRQLAGTVAGTSIGGGFGSSIGGLMGGPRGSDAGTAIGMLVGGVIGNAATSTTGKSEEQYDRNDRNRYERKRDRYEQNRQSSRQTAPQPERIQGLSVENIRFIDGNRNQCLDAGEKASILFEIHNRGNVTLYDIAPSLSCDNPKHISISPTAIISNLRSGGGVTYTAAIMASPRLKSGYATFELAFSTAGGTVVYKTFSIPTAAKR